MATIGVAGGGRGKKKIELCERRNFLPHSGKKAFILYTASVRKVHSFPPLKRRIPRILSRACLHACISVCRRCWIERCSVVRRSTMRDWKILDCSSSKWRGSEPRKHCSWRTSPTLATYARKFFIWIAISPGRGLKSPRSRRRFRLRWIYIGGESSRWIYFPSTRLIILTLFATNWTYVSHLLFHLQFYLTQSSIE